MRALRVVPECLPDLRDYGPGTGIAAGTHPSREVRWGRPHRTDARSAISLGPLPAMPGLRGGLSERCAVWPNHGAYPRPARRRGARSPATEEASQAAAAERYRPAARAGVGDAPRAQARRLLDSAPGRAIRRPTIVRPTRECRAAAPAANRPA